MSRLRRFRVPLILLVLAVSVAAPIILTGYISLARAQSAAAQQRYLEAAQYYEAAARLMPGRSDLWERAGTLAYAGGDQTAATRLLQVAAARNAISARGWDVLASGWWKLGETQSAINAWKAGSLANPRDVQLLDRLVGAYHQQADYSPEEAALVRRLALGDDASANYHLGLLRMLSDPAAARRELLAAGALNPQFAPASTTLTAALDAAALDPDAAKRSILVGRGLGLVNEWGLAARAFARATEVDPENAEAWAWLGEASQHTGEDGLPDLDRALALNPQDGMVRALRGLYWRRQGDNARALAEYLTAAQVEPTNPSMQSSLGEAYTASGDLVEALRAYQSATDLAPEDPTYWRLLALFCADNGVQVLEVGLPAAQKAAQLAPSDAQVLDTLGWSYAQAGSPSKAEQTLAQVIRRWPDLALAHLHLAEVYLMTGESAAALQELNTAAKLDPEGPTGLAAAQLLNRYFP